MKIASEGEVAFIINESAYLTERDFMKAVSNPKRDKKIDILQQHKGEKLKIPKSGIVYSSYDLFLEAFPQANAEQLVNYSFILDEFDSLLFNS